MKEINETEKDKAAVVEKNRELFAKKILPLVDVIVASCEEIGISMVMGFDLSDDNDYQAILYRELYKKEIPAMPLQIALKALNSSNGQEIIDEIFRLSDEFNKRAEEAKKSKIITN